MQPALASARLAPTVGRPLSFGTTQNAARTPATWPGLAGVAGVAGLEPVAEGSPLDPPAEPEAEPESEPEPPPRETIRDDSSKAWTSAIRTNRVDAGPAVSQSVALNGSASCSPWYAGPPVH